MAGLAWLPETAAPPTHSHFCSSSALSVALLGFLFNWKCFTGGVRGPARVVRALLFRYWHSSGSMADASHSLTDQARTNRTGQGAWAPYTGRDAHSSWKTPKPSFLFTVVDLLLCSQNASSIHRTDPSISALPWHRVPALGPPSPPQAQEHAPGALPGPVCPSRSEWAGDTLGEGPVLPTMLK